MKKEKENKFSNEDALFQSLNLIFYAMVAIPLMAFLYIYLEIKDGSYTVITPDPDVHVILLIVVPVFSIINVGVAYYIYRTQVKTVVPTEPLPDKLKKFYYASIYKYSYLEAASLLPLIGLFITGEMIYSAIYLAVLLIYSLNRPTPFRLRKDLKIKTYPPSKGLDEVIKKKGRRTGL